MSETPMDRETAEEIKRHFNVVAESLRSEIRTVAEGLKGFQDRVSAVFKNLHEEFNEVKSMIRRADHVRPRALRPNQLDVNPPS
jgi:hypothetical protein